MHIQAIFVNSSVYHATRSARGGLAAFTANGIIVGLGSHPTIAALPPQKRYDVEDGLLANPLASHACLDWTMLRPLEFVLVACPYETDEIQTTTGSRFEVVNVTVLRIPIREFVRAWRVPTATTTSGLSLLSQSVASHAIRVHAANGGLLSGVAILSSRVSLEADAATRIQSASRVRSAHMSYATLRTFAHMAAREAATSMIALQWRARPLRLKLNLARVARTLAMDSATTAAITDLLDDLAPDFALEIQQCCVSGVPAAPDWASARLSSRDDAMRQEAVSYARSNSAIKDVQVLSMDGRVFEATLPYSFIGSLPLGTPVPNVASAEWNPITVSQSRLDAFVRSSKLYPDEGVPFNVLDPTYHSLVAFDAQGDILGIITIQLATMSSVVSSDPSATMPLIYVALIATHPDTQRKGVGTALYHTAIRACFPDGKRTCPAYVLTEAVSAGDGWKWWKRRVVQKAALAVILAIQLLVVVHGEGALSKGALPCGEMLLL